MFQFFQISNRYVFMVVGCKYSNYRIFLYATFSYDAWCMYGMLKCFNMQHNQFLTFTSITLGILFVCSAVYLLRLSKKTKTFIAKLNLQSVMNQVHLRFLTKI